MFAILYLFTIPSLLVIAYVQYKNWREFYQEKNGDNLIRVALGIVTVAALGVCVGIILVKSLIATIFVSFVPVFGFILYWPQIQKTWPIMAGWILKVLLVINSKKGK